MSSDTPSNMLSPQEHNDSAPGQSDTDAVTGVTIDSKLTTTDTSSHVSDHQHDQTHDNEKDLENQSDHGESGRIEFDVKVLDDIPDDIEVCVRSSSI